MADGRELAYESYDWAEGGRRVHVPLQEGGLPGIELGGGIHGGCASGLEFPVQESGRSVSAVCAFGVRMMSVVRWPFRWPDDLDVRPVNWTG